MTRGYILSNGNNPFQSILRLIFLVAATIGGFFIFAASAAFALFVVIGLLILGLIAFAVLWFRTKILKKPLMPEVKMQSFGSFEMPGEAPFAKPSGDEQDGPVLDAHQTPDGWSVDTD